jgi:hypothetical protein
MPTQMVIWENYNYERRTEHAKQAKKLGHWIGNAEESIKSEPILDATAKKCVVFFTYSGSTELTIYAVFVNSKADLFLSLPLC